MSRSWLYRIVGGVFLAAGVCLAPAAERSGVTVGILKGMMRDVGVAKLEVVTKNFESVLKTQTGLDGQLAVIPSAEELTRKLADGSVHLGAFEGFEFAWMRQRQPALEPVMVVGVAPEGLRAVVVVPKSSPAKNVGDLRGNKLALPKDAPEFIRLFLDRQCRAFGADARQFFTVTSTPDTAEDALDRVADGAAQVAVTDGAAVKALERRMPGRFARMRVLEQSDPFPPAVIAVAKGKLDAGTLRRFRDGMRTADRTEEGRHLMSQMRITRFEAVPTDLDRRLGETAKAYPPQ